MQFTVHNTADILKIKTPALFVGVFKEGKHGVISKDLPNSAEIKNIIRKEFRCGLGDAYMMRDVPGFAAEKVVLIGMGEEDKFDMKALEDAHCAVTCFMEEYSIKEGVSTLLDEEALFKNHEEITLKDATIVAARKVHYSNYKYTSTFKEIPDHNVLKKFGFTTSKENTKLVKDAIATGKAIADGMLLTMQLGDLPSNICTPTYLGNCAKDLAKEYKEIKAEVLGRKQIESLKMGAFLSVAAGASEEPALITLRYTPTKKSSKKPLVFVGKGVTFDSGGISLKNKSGMDEMKFDMCGAASVFGVLKAVAEIGFDREIIGVVAATENMPSSYATKPGDVVTSMSGKTIEILNTDAEGRLLLADVLTYVDKFNPEVVIDIATLTSAIIQALGHVHAGVFSNDEDLADALVDAGEIANDTAWKMPLDEQFAEKLKSNFADCANIGCGVAGSTVAAAFLEKFIGDYKWAHIDIAGVAWNRGDNKGASGRPVALLMAYLLNQ